MDIDRQSRLRYAETLRHFAAGRLTNREYEAAADQLLNSRDPALRGIWWIIWFCYDDLRTHRLAGKWALTSDGKKTVARAVVFLHSEFSYQWPRTPWWRMLFGLLTLGMWSRFFPAKPSGGDDSVWPFFGRADLTAAVARPRLLRGAN